MSSDVIRLFSSIVWKIFFVFLVFECCNLGVFELSSFRDFEFSNFRVLLGSGTDGEGAGFRIIQTHRPIIINT